MSKAIKVLASYIIKLFLIYCFVVYFIPYWINMLEKDLF